MRKKKRKEVFTYSVEERKAFEEDYWSGRYKGKLKLTQYFDLWGRAHKKGLDEEYRLWFERTSGKLDLSGAPYQKKPKKNKTTYVFG
jgi:hypothetical protein